MEKFRMNFMMVMLGLVSLFTLTLSSCDDDEDDKPAPTVTAPTEVTSVVASGTGDISFTIATPNGYKSSEVTATGGTATLKSEPTVGDKEGTVVVTFTAGATTGAGSLVLTVTDNTNKTGNSTAVVNVGVDGPTDVSANITSNATWTKDNRYMLKGNIFVTNGATLTIEPGTIIFGDKVTKGALIIERGSKINAAGTETQPIIFTSSAPAGFRNYGDWGGVVILGRAVNNQGENVNIEGVTAGETGKHGGTDNADNSGVFKYVRIEFAGIALSTDNELNGLTLGSVGSGTEIHHIQISYSGDDSFEWFGGTANATHLVAYKGWDDDFDTDFGFTGKVQYAASFRNPDIADKSGSNLFESDNDGNGTANTPLTSPVFSNVTAFGPFVYARLSSGALSNSNASANFQNAGHIRRNSAMKLYNSAIIGYGTTNNFGFRFTDSKGGANAAADFKKNYIARIVGTLKAPATGATDKGYSVDTFDADNILANPLNGVDLSTIFTALDANENIDQPLANVVPAAGSIVLTGALDLSATGLNLGLEKTDYIGAIGTTNWLSATWLNFDPQNTQY
jgi:hypothetical protein